MIAFFELLDSAWQQQQLEVNGRQYLKFYSDKLKVSSIFTTRTGGASKGDYSSYNLAVHVEDELNSVVQNRNTLSDDLGLPVERYLNQTHSCNIGTDALIHTECDGLITSQLNNPAVVMTADCMPVMICDSQGKQVSAIHAGWKGLLNGIVEKAFSHFKSGGYYVVGPHISQQKFEVGAEVRAMFIDKYDFSERFFMAEGNKFLFDMNGIVDEIAKAFRMTPIVRFQGCTYKNDEYFYSYRRQQICGRQASLIWRNE